MFLETLLFVVTQGLIPMFLIIWVWIEAPRSRLESILKASCSGAYLLFIFVVGRWDYTGYYSRYLILFVFFMVVLRNMAVVRQRKPGHTAAHSHLNLRTVIYGLTTIVLLNLSFISFSGHFYGVNPVKIKFPMREGIYYAAQGGASSLINSHFTKPSQAHAVDITRLNIFGLQTKGLWGSSAVDFGIYGDSVFSPCVGVITEVVDGSAESPDRELDKVHSLGNRITIRFEGVLITFGHLLESSAGVSQGDSILEGQYMARVGRSGNVSQPSLHIHAVDSSNRSIPLGFDRLTLERNSIFTEGIRENQNRN